MTSLLNSIQRTITCSKSTKETLGTGVKYIQLTPNTRMRSLKFPLQSSGNHKFSDDFRGNRSNVVLVCFSGVSIVTLNKEVLTW